MEIEPTGVFYGCGCVCWEGMKRGKRQVYSYPEIFFFFAYSNLLNGNDEDRKV